MNLSILKVKYKPNTGTVNVTICTVISAKCFKFSVDRLKVKFYGAFNCIYSRVKAPNSELVMVQLLKFYCLPFLLYASEAVRPSCSNVQSLENCSNQAMYRIFMLVVRSVLTVFVNLLPSLSILIGRRRQKFVDRLLTNNQCTGSKLFLMNVDY